MRNPYFHRAMIRQAEGFVGRERELRHVYSCLAGTQLQNVSIVGERRIGKSSLLYCLSLPEVQARLGFDLSGITFLYLDLETQTRIKPGQFLAHLLRMAGEQAPQLQLTISDSMDTYGFGEAIATLNEADIRPVFFLDEFDAVTRNEHFDLDFFSGLRAATNRYDVALITASRENLKTLCHASIADSPFFNSFSVVRLGLFPENEAVELIAEPSATSGVPLEEHSKFVLDMAGQHPFFIQMLCFHLWEAVRSARRPVDLTAVEKAFLEEAQEHYAYTWEHLTGDERRVLKGWANKEAVVATSEMLEQLARKTVVSEGAGQPQPFSSGFAAFVRSNRARLEAADRPASKPKARKNFWQEWRPTLVLVAIGLAMLIPVFVFVEDPQIIATSVLIPLFMLIIGIVIERLKDKK